MAYPQKEKRNKEMVSKRKGDPKKWSLTALANHYNLNRRTVYDILKRELGDLSVGSYPQANP